MLPAAARLTASHEYRLVVRRGRRAGRSRLVVHVLFGADSTCTTRRDTADAGCGSTARSEVSSTPTRGSTDTPSARVGFVVSKAVGNSVVRHRVTRRLRHLMRDRLPSLSPGTLVVVRALRPAADASSRELGADLDAALRKVWARSRGQSGRRGRSSEGPAHGQPRDSAVAGSEREAWQATTTQQHRSTTGCGE